MIYHFNSVENTKNSFSHAISELHLGKLLRKVGITKNCGHSAFEVFQFLLLLVFQGKNLFRFLDSKKKDMAFSKNTYYRFLNETTYNWRRFLLLLAAQVISSFSRLTRPERVKCLVVDDTVVTRSRSKHVELLANIYDHVDHKYKRGFTMLNLAWTDGYSLIPIAFNLLSSSNKSNRYQEMREDIDHRTNGYKNRREAVMKKPEALILMVKRAFDAGIQADYILMDTWFTTEPILHSMLEAGIHVIGMVKQLKQTYLYNGHYYTLPQLRKFMQRECAVNIFGSVVVRTKKENIPVKIVVIRNRNKSNDCLYLLTTDCSLSETEVVRLYGNRWSIECFHKASKSFLKLGSEFQSRSYDAMVCHTTIVVTRFILLEWIRRNENDHKTFGELFFLLCDDIGDMELETSLKSLMLLMVQVSNNVQKELQTYIQSEVNKWMCSQPIFIQALFSDGFQWA